MKNEKLTIQIKKKFELKTYTSKECRDKISPCVADNINAFGRVDLTKWKENSK